jgi:microcystin degradation protein MlrC
MTTTGKNLAIARLWHEGNSFNPIPTRLHAFQQREWISGDRAMSYYADTATEMGAVVDFLHQQEDWRGHFLRCTSAPPGGPATQSDLTAICDEIIDGLQDRQWDAVYLSLHGALLGTGDNDADHSLLRRVRRAIGPDIPVAVSFDMHACLNPEIAGLVQVLAGYKTYPHVDMYETGARALGLLDQCVRGDIHPQITLCPVPMLPGSHNMRTDAGPMADLVALASETQNSAAGLYDVTVFAGFAYADSPQAHATISICHAQGADIAATGARIGQAMLARRAAFRTHMPDARQGIQQALTLLANGARWPVAIIETSDNPLSGGLGDTTGLLRALLGCNTERPAIFSFFHDPYLVEHAQSLGEGAAISARLGGRIAREFGAPVDFEGYVTRLTEGRFTNTGPMERGMPVDIGPGAVLQAGAIKVVISSSCQSVNDPGWCTAHGIDLRQTALFCVKAKNHFRAGFGSICSTIIDVETPGPAPADLRQIPYSHVPPAFVR